ncbi:MAG: hypothetical protein PUC50_01365 [Bacteroidales bacterium]|nr:hypothetical protein [Bacteroidales bacterium]
MKNNYINPQNPVYFSYAGGEEKTEKIVKQLRELFEQENIDYRDYQSDRTPFDYRKPLIESEKEIGNGNFIVVIFSNKYVDLNFNGQTSLHCMNEWHNITQLANFEQHIFPIFVEDELKKRLSTEQRFNSLQESYDAKYKEISNKEAKNFADLTELEKKFLDTNGDAFKKDLVKIRKWMKDCCYTVNNLSVVVQQIKECIFKNQSNSKLNTQSNVVVLSSNGKTMAVVRIPIDHYGECEIIRSDIKEFTCEGQYITNQQYTISTFIKGEWQQNKHKNWITPTVDRGGMNISGSGEGGNDELKIRYDIDFMTLDDTVN